MALVLFDLDKTLLSKNSANLWVKEQWKTGQIGHTEMIKTSLGFLRYYLGSSSVENEIRNAILTLEGRNESSVSAEIEKFYNKSLKNIYRPGALAALEKHRQNKDKLVLLTSSPYPLAKLAAADLNLDACLCTRFEVNEQGNYTGQIQGTICYGKGKAEVAHEYVKSLDICWSTCIFYSDSITDLPTFQKVGYPIAVNPDPRLLRMARKQKWPIVDWGRPHEQTRP